MRITKAIIAFTALALPAVASAQSAPAASGQATAKPATASTAPAPAAAKASAAASTDETTPMTGSFDFGVMGTSLTGDGARYERYRDLSNGLFLENLRVNSEWKGWFFEGAGDHLGRLDQRLGANLVKPGAFKLWGSWDQIPMLMSRTTQTLYTFDTPGVFRIADNLQTQLQTSAALISTIVPQFQRPFDTESRRHIADGGFQYLPSVNTTVRFDVQHMNREGVIPYGGTFGFSNAIELPVPVNHHLTDVNTSVEHSRGDLLLRLGYSGSMFHNDVSSITWDNPYRLTDSATVPSQGREPLAPSNTFHVVNGSASYKLPAHSRFTAYASLGVLKDDGITILPMTINTALPVIPLDRSTVNGEAHTRAANVSFTSRPTRDIGLDVRYRYYDFDNRTPVFTQTSRVAYDTTVQAVSPANETGRYGGHTQSFDADVRVSMLGSGQVSAGFSRNEATYNERIFSSSVENTGRVKFEILNTRYVSLHSKYEHAVRRGRDLDTAELIADGEQPGMRTFDIADRDRDLGTLVATFTPMSSLMLSVSGGGGRDKYPNSQFGLFNANHKTYSVGADATPGDNLVFSASYDMDDYRTLQWSRQANPGAQAADPSRDWSTDGHDKVHSVIASMQVLKIGNKLNLKLSYDLSDGNTLYLYGGAGAAITVDRTLPEESPIVPSTLPAPKQLPTVTGRLTRGTLDLNYPLTSRAEIGVSYWYEQYQVTDFALDAQAISQINLPSALLIGYQYLPYTAHTVFGRLMVRW